MTSGWLVSTYALAFMMAFAIGANDAANGLGIPYGTKAISLIWMLVIGALGEFIGAMFCSGQVTDRLSRGIINDLDTHIEETQMIVMFSITFAAFIFIMAASISRMPISGTHAVVGGVIGAGLAITDTSNINFKAVIGIVIQWFTSPILSMIIAFILMSLVSLLTLRTSKMTYGARLVNLQIICSFSFLVMGEMLWIMFTGKDTAKKWNKFRIGVDIGSIIIGFFTCRFLIHYIPPKLNPNKQGNQGNNQDEAFNVGAFFSFWSTQHVQHLTRQLNVGEEAIDDKVESNKHQIEFERFDPLSINFKYYVCNHKIQTENDGVKGVNNAPLLEANINSLEYDSLWDEEKKEMIFCYQQALITSSVYRFLVVVSMFLVCLSHGSNDVANAISPLVYLIQLDRPDTPSFWPYLYGSTGIAVGLVVYGRRVMSTVGKSIITLDFIKGYATQFAAGISVCIGSIMGTPLSTTHAVIGGLVGVHLATKYVSWVREAYGIKKQEQSAPDEDFGSISNPIKLDEEEINELAEDKGINTLTIKKIIIFCLITIPCSFIMSYIITALLVWVVII